MNLIYSDNLNIPNNGIFLAGPTLRGGYSKESWRYKAIEFFSQHNYNGNILIPEYEITKKFIDTDENIVKQTRWEWSALKKSTVILFWIPRDLKTLPAFTTNVEFGRYTAISPEKVILGHPINAPKMRYLDLLYKETTNRSSLYTLEETITQSIILYNKLT